MKFYYFHLMPYPLDHDEPSSWVTLSNRHYDPKLGHVLYNQYLDQLEYAEQLGFDGLCVNEHHQNCYGTMPRAQRDRRHARAAHEPREDRASSATRCRCATTRCASPRRSRCWTSSPAGASSPASCAASARSTSRSGVNPTHSRERFHEAAELILRAWTGEGPFAFDGKYYRFHYVNPWPRPLQKPHPPIWCPSQGSSETVEWAAKRRFPYLMVFTPIARIKQIYGEYREACERNGYTASRYQLSP